MKVQLINSITQAGTNIKFHKGRVYNATVAANQPRYMRLIKNQTDLKVNKIFVNRGEDSCLAEEKDFTIISFPELKELLFNYKQSKIHIPRGPKLIVPKGRILRDNFNLFIFDNLNFRLRSGRSNLFHRRQANGTKIILFIIIILFIPAIFKGSEVTGAGNGGL